jgi:hypothetical protein
MSIVNYLAEHVAERPEIPATLVATARIEGR